jgi:hypothetical protein
MCRGASMTCMKSHLAEMSNSATEALSPATGGIALQRPYLISESVGEIID